jgi:hypothetical protein
VIAAEPRAALEINRTPKYRCARGGEGNLISSAAALGGRQRPQGMSSFNNRRLLRLWSVLPEPPQVALANSRAGSVEELEDLYRWFSSATDAIAESRRRDLAVLTARREDVRPPLVR